MNSAIQAGGETTPNGQDMGKASRASGQTTIKPANAL
jgi:hypothetical protein